MNITVTIPFLYNSKPSLSVEIDASIEAKFHFRAAVTQAISQGANLDGANLDSANLYGANLDGANLYGANLYGANLDGANLYGANLTRANLDGANLYGANLTRANLDSANLTRANLDSANLDSANLDGETKLLCYGDMKRIKTMQLDRWAIGYSATHLQIGCQLHPIEKWMRWDTPAGRKWIASMDDSATAWADKYLRVVLALIAVNPAV